MTATFKLGVTLYSYTGDYGVTMTLEDCIADAVDAGAQGIEILSETHIPGYPNPSDAWVDHWHGLMAKYGTDPDLLRLLGRLATVQRPHPDACRSRSTSCCAT